MACSALCSTKIHQMLSDSEPLQVLFACGRLSALPTSPDWACIPGVAGRCPLPFQVPHAVKRATAFSFYPCKSSVNLSVPLLFCAVSSNKKAFPLLPCQREWLGKRGYEEHIPVQCYYTVVDILGEQLQCTQVSTTWCKAPQSATIMHLLLVAPCFARLQLMRPSWLHTLFLVFMSEYKKYIWKRWQKHFICMSAGNLKYYGKTEALPVILQLLAKNQSCTNWNVLGYTRSVDCTFYYSSLNPRISIYCQHQYLIILIFL